MKEQDLKLAVSQYLEYLTNQGKVYADRLNSGSVLVKKGAKTYRVGLCREGTADFMMFKKVNVEGVDFLRLIFLELKGERGKASPAQNAFQVLVEAEGAEYHIVRRVEEVAEILGEEMTK